MSFFEPLQMLPEDPILSIPILFKADPRPNKVNLGIGSYKGSDGKPVVLSCVRKAENILFSKNLDKEYLPIDGNPEYNKETLKLIFGRDLPRINSGEIIALQTFGGTGALRMGGEFLHRNQINTIYLPDPTWANHSAIFGYAGLAIKNYPYYSNENHGLDFSAMCQALNQLPAKSVILLHACCHNPTGSDPSKEQWKELSHLMKKRHLFPFFDLAYQGFGNGLDEDAYAVRCFMEDDHEMFVANSFSKNLGLYGERVGMLSIVSKASSTAKKVLSHMKQIARGSYSMPALNGARIVAEILKTETLFTEWLDELAGMRNRIKQMRLSLVSALQKENVENRFNFLLEQSGIFSFTELLPEQIQRLQAEYAIFMISNGRINVAGLNEHNIHDVAKAIAMTIKS